MTPARFAFLRAHRHALWQLREWRRVLSEPSTFSMVVWLLVGLAVLHAFGALCLWTAGLGVGE